jgi:hypothetical protein
MEDVLSYNVIGEIKGSIRKISWSWADILILADGSHDDGAGVVQSMEVLNIFKNLGINLKYDSSSSL